MRKEIERAFGVLQGKWNTISRSSKFMTVESKDVRIKCVIILHNMIVEERCADELVGEVENNTDVWLAVDYLRCGAVCSA